MANPEHIKIAKQGKDAWNEWRKTTDEPADFSGYDFRDNPIDFHGFEFGDEAYFNKSTFGEWARFDNATFGRWANFKSAIFADIARFDGALFDDGADFSGATFGHGTNFNGTIFGEWVYFRGCHFKGDVTFSSQSEVRWQKNSQQPRDTEPFEDIDFSNSRFDRQSTFSNRRFEGEIDLTGCRFRQPPDFSGTQNHDRISWKGAHFDFSDFSFFPLSTRITNNYRIPTHLRRLRKIAADIHDTDTERDLFILERAAERGVYWAQGRKWKAIRESLLFFLYWLVSDCGKSIK